MKIYGTPVAATFAEAFPMQATRLLVTARSRYWARQAARSATGFATSVIACGCEAGIERELDVRESPDGRPGVALLFFAMSIKELARQVQNRVGQCILTCPSSACFAGFNEGAALPLGKNLRYFADGFQSAKQINGVRYWRIPTMDGEFLCQEESYARKAIGGGNFLLLARDEESALRAGEAAVTAIASMPEVITPFPGGIVRSGSKVGSIYPKLLASTNQAFCPTLRGLVPSALPPGTGCVLEIVIDGLHADAIRHSIRAGIQAGCQAARLLGVSAGNYGGSLGPHHFHLREILA